MSELNSHDPRLADVERRLAALSPRDAQLNVAETLFRAGQESALHHQTRLRIAWPLVTAASVLLSVVTTAAVVRRPEQRFVDVDRSIAVPEQDAEDAEDTAAEPRVPDRREAIRPARDWVAEQRPQGPLAPRRRGTAARRPSLLPRREERTRRRALPQDP